MSNSEVTKPLNTWDQDSFLPEDYVKSKGERRANMLSLTLFGVMMLAVVAAFFATNRRWMSVRSEQRSINAMYVREAEKIEDLKTLEKQRAEMVVKAEVTAALVERVPRSVLFAELINRMPADLTLTEFAFKSDEVKVKRGTSRSSGVRTLSGRDSNNKSRKDNANTEEESSVYIPQYNQSLTIVGVGMSNDDIADYIENLRNCELLDNVELKYIKESKIDGVELRSFELSSTIRDGADARGLVEAPALVVTDVLTPERLIPQMPVILPPSVGEEADTEDDIPETDRDVTTNESDEIPSNTEFDGDTETENSPRADTIESETPAVEAEDTAKAEVNQAAGPTLKISSMPDMSVFSESQSQWASPGGLLELMASAARTGERVRSEKAAAELMQNPVDHNRGSNPEETVDENGSVEPEPETESGAELGTDPQSEPETTTGDLSADDDGGPSKFWFSEPEPTDVPAETEDDEGDK